MCSRVDSGENGRQASGCPCSWRSFSYRGKYLRSIFRPRWERIICWWSWTRLVSVCLLIKPTPHKAGDRCSKEGPRAIPTFELPFLIRSNPGTDFTQNRVNHCRWLHMSVNYRLAKQSRAQGTIDKIGVWLRAVLGQLCKTWPKGTHCRHCGFTAQQPTRAYPDTRLRSAWSLRLLSSREAHIQLDAVQPDEASFCS